MAILDLSKSIIILLLLLIIIIIIIIHSFLYREIGGKFILITIRKSYIYELIVPKSVTFNDLERRNGPYSALFH